LDKKYYIKTFGCQMNIRDSEQIAALLDSAGYESIGNAQKADLIILNTCSIREKAAQKAYSQLGRFKDYKKKNPHLIIGVGGCLAQQWGKNIFKKAPYLDLVFGTSNIQRLPELISTVETDCKQVVATELIESSEDANIQTLPQKDQVSAYVTINQGCNNFCSYCVVPYLRGPEKSRESGRIIAEVERLAEYGIKEVTLLGQNVNSYGVNNDDGVYFPNLLKEINKIQKIERIRFTTSHPKDMSPELIDCFSELDKLCEHIHLPMQSGSDEVLKRMNRGYSNNTYLKKVEQLKTVCPDISITSDVIVGFPGETDWDFKATIDMMERIRFDGLYSFKYSERENTAAATLDNKVSEQIKKQRLQTLQSLQDIHTLEKNNKMVGQSIDVLVEGLSKNSQCEVTGRTRTNKVVNFKGGFEIIGKTVSVIITEAYLHSLHGEIQLEKETDRC
jgi:tRNA-2-methylthio-N6-dimethylallyladenosine synthase